MRNLLKNCAGDCIMMNIEFRNKHSHMRMQNCNNITAGSKDAFDPAIKFIETYHDKIGEKDE